MTRVYDKVGKHLPRTLKQSITLDNLSSLPPCLTVIGAVGSPPNIHVHEEVEGMSEEVSVPQTEEDWLECIALPKYLAKIPAGHNIYITGEEIWVDGNGVNLARESYIAFHGCDPVVVWAAKKKYLAEKGPGVHIESSRGGTPVKLGKY